jgi:transcriptional regulator with XRE-family HTH domain
MIVQIQQAVRDSGLTLGELGRTTGVSAGQLSRFLRGERMLSLPATAKLCEALRLHLVQEKAAPTIGRARRAQPPPSSSPETPAPKRRKPREK